MSDILNAAAMDETEFMSDEELITEYIEVHMDKLETVEDVENYYLFVIYFQLNLNFF